MEQMEALLLKARINLLFFEKLSELEQNCSLNIDESFYGNILEKIEMSLDFQYKWLEHIIYNMGVDFTNKSIDICCD